MNPTEHFFRQQLPALISAKPALFGQLKKPIQFSVEGVGDWAIETGSTPQVVTGKLPQPGTQLHCSSSTFTALVAGAMTVREAFDSSVLRIGGDVAVGMKLGVLFKPLAGSRELS